MHTISRLLQLGSCLFAGMIALAGVLLLSPETGKAQPNISPGVLYVAPGGNCGSASPCYGSVQAAVDAALPDDEIRIAAGTYAGVNARAGFTQTVYLSKSMIMRGGYTTTDCVSSDPAHQPTALDTQGQGRVPVIAGPITAIVEGLSITFGFACGCQEKAGMIY